MQVTNQSMMKKTYDHITDNRIFWLVHYKELDIYQPVYEYANRKYIQ